MGIHASGEDYLEAVLVLRQKKGAVRSVDLAHHLGFSKPSVSHAVSVLRSGGFLEMDQEGFLSLTEAGYEIAAQIYERHCYFRDLLISAGVDLQTAEQEACKMEHAISTESYRRLRQLLDGRLKTEKDWSAISEKTIDMVW